MKFLVENWMLLLTLLIVLITAIYNIKDFMKKPTEQQINSFKEWLIYAVIKAEKYFGSGTGILKLRYVYDLFLKKFPYLSTFISFEKFRRYVDDSLDKAESILKGNDKIKDYIERKD